MVQKFIFIRYYFNKIFIIMKKKYHLHLTNNEREHLFEVIGRGSCPARKQTRARLLLKLDEGQEGPAWSDAQAAEAMEVCEATAARMRRQFGKEGLEATLNRKAPDREYERKMDGQNEAHLIRLACSKPPEGRDRWTLRLLADRMVQLGYLETLSYETVRSTLKKTSSNLISALNG
jgi:transposase